MMQSLVRFTLAFMVSLTLGACATRAPTVVIPDGALQRELVSKSQKIQDFTVLKVPFVLASAPKRSANMDLKFRILTRGL